MLLDYRIFSLLFMVAFPVGSSTADCRCGIINTPPPPPLVRSGHRIVGGRIAPKNKYPWQVSIHHPDGFPFCGGSIISSKDILTAAHCVQDKFGKLLPGLYVKIGEHNQWKKDGEKNMTIHSTILHPKWNRTVRDFDYAILILSEEIQFTKEVSPICLPTKHDTDVSLEEGVDVIATGWGVIGGTIRDKVFTYMLQEIKMKSISNENCTTKLSNEHNWRVHPITDRMICAFADGKSTCFGDSGGPLITKVGQNYVQIGVTSFGPGLETDGKDHKACSKGIAMFARVSDQLEWITSTIEGRLLPRNEPPSWAHKHFGCRSNQSSGEDSNSSFTEEDFSPSTEDNSFSDEDFSSWDEDSSSNKEDSSANEEDCTSMEEDSSYYVDDSSNYVDDSSYYKED